MRREVERRSGSLCRQIGGSGAMSSRDGHSFGRGLACGSCVPLVFVVGAQGGDCVKESDGPSRGYYGIVQDLFGRLWLLRDFRRAGAILFLLDFATHCGNLEARMLPTPLECRRTPSLVYCPLFSDLFQCLSLVW